MAEEELNGLTEPEHDDRDDRDDVQADPVGLGHRIREEVGPDDELVGETEGHAQVGIQVDEVPGLVRETSARHPHRRDAHGDQHHQPDGTHEDVRIRRQERPRLGQEVAAARQGKARRRQDGVGDEEPHAAETDPAVPAREARQTDQPIQPRAPRHQHQADQREVRPEQGRDLARGDEQGSRGRQSVEAAMADPHPDDEQPIPDRDRQDIARQQRARGWHVDPTAGGRKIGHVQCDLRAAILSVS